MLWISLYVLPKYDLPETLTATLCLTVDKSDTAGQFRSHEDSVQRVYGVRNIEFILKGLDFHDSGRH